MVAFAQINPINDISLSNTVLLRVNTLLIVTSGGSSSVASLVLQVREAYK